MNRSHPYSGELHELVEAVKDGQRSSREWRDAWCVYCDQYGDGCYDPTRFDARYLRAALLALQSPGVGGRVAGGGSRFDTRGRHGVRGYSASYRSDRDLTEQIKEYQRSGDKRWVDYCDQFGNGAYDPRAYDGRFLRGALRALQSYGGGGYGGSAGGPLTERVKALQRTSAEARKAWEEYCVGEGDATLDPARHDTAFVLEGIRRMESASLPPLVCQVKNMQRESAAARETWVQLCTTDGGGTFDPTKHSEEFLRTAVQKMGGTGATSKEEEVGDLCRIMAEAHDDQNYQKAEQLKYRLERLGITVDLLARRWTSTSGGSGDF